MMMKIRHCIGICAKTPRTFCCNDEDQVSTKISESKSDWERLQQALESSASLRGSWKALAVEAGIKADERFDSVCYVENTKTDTQVIHILIHLHVVHGW